MKIVLPWIGRLLFALALLVASAGVARAGEPSEFQQAAESAWSNAKYEEAERQYRILIERGSLAPDEILNAYVRLGAARAMLGKRKEATAAFRAAGILRNDFAVPRGLELRVGPIADAARKEVAAIGTMHFTATFPERARAGEALHALAALDEAHVPTVARISIRVVTTAREKPHAASEATGTSVDFLVPAEAVAGPGKLTIEIAAEDKFGNHLAAERTEIDVGANPLAQTGGTAPAKPGKSFWATPWPYIGLGILAVGGGAAAYYYGLRPTVTVAVGRVQLAPSH